MVSKNKQILIWGAGKIGRGFIADLFSGSGYFITFVDADRNLVDELNRRGSYGIVKLPAEGPKSKTTIVDFKALPVEDTESINACITRVPLIAVVVFPAIFAAVAEMMAPGIEERSKKGPMTALDILLCANTSRPAEEFRPLLRDVLSTSGRAYFDRYVGLIDTVIMRIGIPPEKKYTDKDPLVVVTNGYPEMPVDRFGFKAPLPAVRGLVPSDRIGAEEIRKIYCYNMAHAALAYGGFLKGYQLISQAAEDPEVAREVQAALSEVSNALVVEGLFSAGEMQDYANQVVAYFRNPALPDTVERVGADPKRKLARNDRLIGPAMLCRKYRVIPQSLMGFVAKAFLFDYPRDPSAGEVRRAVSSRGIDWCLDHFCGLNTAGDLKDITQAHYQMLLSDKSS